MTLEQAKQMITKMGGTVLDAACWEDAEHIYASSVETVPGCLGHPKYEISIRKEKESIPWGDAMAYRSRMQDTRKADWRGIR